MIVMLGQRGNPRPPVQLTMSLSRKDTPPLLTIRYTSRRSLSDQLYASFRNSPICELSKHLVFVFSPLVGKFTCYVRNSAEFSSYVAGQTLHNVTILVSFDVMSLFMNMPAYHAVNVASGRLSADTSLTERVTLSVEQAVVSLPHACLDANLPGIQMGVLPADVQHSHELPSVWHSDQPHHGKGEGESTVH